MGAWADFSSIIVQQLYAVDVAKLQWRLELEANDYDDVCDTPGEYDRRRLSGDDDYGVCPASEFDLLLMFRDANGDMLSKASLNALKDAQNEVAKLGQYKTICMKDANGDCLTLSPANLAMLLNDVVCVGTLLWSAGKTAPTSPPP